jgi:hypothetical protein
MYLIHYYTISYTHKDTIQLALYFFLIWVRMDYLKIWSVAREVIHTQHVKLKD